MRSRLIACAAVLAAALALVFLQPVTEPWWIHGDPDGSYVGSSLNILDGNHTYHLDHPGLPTQDAVALAYGAEYLVEKARGSVHTRQAFIDRELLNLDRGRPLYRTWAIAVFLAGAVLVYWALALFFGHWSWGIAGGLLYLGAPALADRAFGLRPDSPLAALCAVVAVLVASAFTRRSPARYAWAAFLAGLALTFKLPAIDLAAALIVAAVWRPPEPGWGKPLAARAAKWMRRHVYWLVPLAGVWVYLCFLFDRERLPILTTDTQKQLVVTWGVVLAFFIVVGAIADRYDVSGVRRLFSVFTALILVAFTAGYALPVSLIMDDGIQAAVGVSQSLSGGKVNENVHAFSFFSFRSLFEYPVRSATLLVVLAFVAAVVGARRRIWWPGLLALTALALGVMAAARLSYPNYYAPAAAVAIPPALWLLKGRRATVPLVGWLIVLAVIAPVFQHLQTSVDHDIAVNAAAGRLADRLLKPGEVIVAPYDVPIEDVRYDVMVDGYVDYVPPSYHYRFLLVGSPVLTERHLTPRYYIASAVEISAIPSGTRIDLGGVSYGLRPTSTRWGPGNAYGVAELVAS